LANRKLITCFIPSRDCKNLWVFPSPWSTYQSRWHQTVLESEIFHTVSTSFVGCWFWIRLPV